MNCLCFWCSRVRVDVEWMLSFDVLKRQRFDARTVDKGIAKVILQRTRTVYFDIEAFCGALIREENFVHGRFEKLRRAAATIMADLFLTVDESIYAVHPDLVPNFSRKRRIWCIAWRLSTLMCPSEVWHNRRSGSRRHELI